ncbi:Hypothetical predicted protein, partial [Mytilus galloprovincialis]
MPSTHRQVQLWTKRNLVLLYCENYEEAREKLRSALYFITSKLTLESEVLLATTENENYKHHIEDIQHLLWVFIKDTGRKRMEYNLLEDRDSTVNELEEYLKECQNEVTHILEYVGWTPEHFIKVSYTTGIANTFNDK